MQKNRKIFRKLAIGLSILALSTTAIIGCSSEKTTQGDTGSKGSTGSTQALTSLTYWVEMHADAAAIMKSYAEITAYKEIVKNTGVTLEFQHPAQGQTSEQFNLMVASKSLPDVVEYRWNAYPGGAKKAIKDGKIIPLNDYLDNAPNLKRLFDENPEWRKQASTDDGDLIGFPFIRPDKKLQTFVGPVLRKDWLEKLGLTEPKTIDEWYTVLKAFKEQDPNGNGEADEIPIMIAAGDIAFTGAFGVPNDFYLEGGTVKYGPIQPEFKQYLATMNKWYKEGLLDKDFAANDSKMYDAKMTGNLVGAAVMTVGAGIGRFMDLMASKDPQFKLAAVSYPTVNPGDKPIFGQKDNPVTGQFAAITGNNKHIAETVKFLDYLYSDEGHMIMNFGKEGETYTLVDGYPKFTDTVMKNPDGMPLAQALKKHVMSAIQGPFVQDMRYLEQYLTKPEQKEALTVWTEPTNEKKMPPITIANEDNSRYTSIMNDVNTYKDEMIVKFIMGAESLDKYDEYVNTLKQMGIEEAIKIQQSGLERYNKR
ncbi:extracellular solute-binding protein [Paenibacillus alkalitolerans]|uniref:extracellular solute-binding protein n=1 Tax=Paenibacillus alkalitolerans TaxID=2799335 RepID=UPI0018F35508|nr:extracellular solute-binding protein [Paenibacillus alkalitolerans]